MGFINKPTTGCLTLNDVGYEESRKSQDRYYVRITINKWLLLVNMG